MELTGVHDDKLYLFIYLLSLFFIIFVLSVFDEIWNS